MDEKKITQKDTENKRLIVKKLCEVLQLTRAGRLIDSLKYEPEKDSDDEFVAIIYRDGSPKAFSFVDVTGDSGISLIRDVIKAL